MITLQRSNQFITWCMCTHICCKLSVNRAFFTGQAGGITKQHMSCVICSLFPSENETARSCCFCHVLSSSPSAHETVTVRIELTGLTDCICPSAAELGMCHNSSADKINIKTSLFETLADLHCNQQPALFAHTAQKQADFAFHSLSMQYTR